jgi:hypothetical protein
MWPLITLGTALGGLASALAVSVARYKSGFREGRAYEKTRQLEQRRVDERRQARSDPPAEWYAPPPPCPPAQRPREARRIVTTAAGIPPVIVPRPGVRIPLSPQAGRDSGAGTVTMPRLTDTGELRALRDRADEFIARMRADDANWRHERGLDQ